VLEEMLLLMQVQPAVEVQQVSARKEEAGLYIHLHQADQGLTDLVVAVVVVLVACLAEALVEEKVHRLHQQQEQPTQVAEAVALSTQLLQEPLVVLAMLALPIGHKEKTCHI